MQTERQSITLTARAFEFAGGAAALFSILALVNHFQVNTASWEERLGAGIFGLAGIFVSLLNRAVANDLQNLNSNQ